MYYFDWLISKVDLGINDTYMMLLSDLYHKDFTWIIPKDENRAKDGIELRHEYIQETGDANGVSAILLNHPVCSLLEMLIAMSERFARDVIGNGVMRPQEWFWKILSNVNLLAFGDMIYDSEAVNAILDNILARRYEYDGSGSFFPLEHPNCDQRKVEIWYQQAQWWEENRYRL